MRILPINNSYSKPQFKGKINECDFLKKALTHFNEAELKEFNALKEKMAKVNDGLSVGHTCPTKTKSTIYSTNSEIFILFLSLHNSKPCRSLRRITQNKQEKRIKRIIFLKLREVANI